MNQITQRIGIWFFTMTIFVAAIVVGLTSAKVNAATQTKRPNVVLVMTDDQGYGDLGCHGNPIIKTPNLDALHARSVRLTNFHVDPTCSPTRSALMSGRYSSRTGVWHTIMGRSMMHTDEVTIAEVFAGGGYRTGIFGKWHLGDNYPCRPQDQGFQEVLINGGGGVTQTPDFWDNDYFDDTYYHNGKPQKYTGYCTDIWFDNAIRFISENKDRPFFCYIPTNAPHGPFNVDKKYSDVYEQQGVPAARAKFWGMISNIDENMGRLQTALKDLGLAENTILVFMTDNGTAAGYRAQRRNRNQKKKTSAATGSVVEIGFNAGMRGTKGSEYDGGHRVPGFFHWPAGNIGGGKDVANLTAHVDMLPTLVDLCGLKLPSKNKLDGTSLVGLLTGDKNNTWPKRTLIVHSQRIEFPKKWRKAAVMTDRWRFVTDANRRELFDMQADPSQKTNVSEKHPHVFARLSKDYENWYEDISDRFEDYVRIGLGSPHENPARLTCHDWHTNGGPVPWNHGHIRRDLKSNGSWEVDVHQAGRYEITLRTRPKHVGHSLNSVKARIKLGDLERSKELPGSGVTSVTFSVTLKKGPEKFQSWLENKDGVSRGAYFVDVKRVE
jgi:arylsulfatase A-like enzyme